MFLIPVGDWSMKIRNTSALAGLSVFTLTLIVCGVKVQRLRAGADAGLLGVIGAPLILPGYLIIGFAEKWVDGTLRFHHEWMVVAAAAFWGLAATGVAALAKLALGSSVPARR